VGWQKKGVGHEVFLTKKGGAPKNIGSEGGSTSFKQREAYCDPKGDILNVEITANIASL
jgi:hypothetical protein